MQPFPWPLYQSWWRVLWFHNGVLKKSLTPFKNIVFLSCLENSVMVTASCRLSNSARILSLYVDSYSRLCCRVCSSHQPRVVEWSTWPVWPVPSEPCFQCCSLGRILEILHTWFFFKREKNKQTRFCAPMNILEKVKHAIKISSSASLYSGWGH